MSRVPRPKVVVTDSTPLKQCEQCDAWFPKKPTLSWAAWNTARFCSRFCTHAWLRANVRRGPSTQIGFCLACDATFRAVGNQRFCRRKACQSDRLWVRLGFDRAIADTPTNREIELRHLTDAQWADDRGLQRDAQHGAISLDRPSHAAARSPLGAAVTEGDRPFTASVPRLPKRRTSERRGD